MSLVLKLYIVFLWWEGMSSQDGINKIMSRFDQFHLYIIFFLLLVLSLILLRILNLIFNTKQVKGVRELQLLEFVWTLLPAVILTLLGAPRLSLLFSLERVQSPELTTKVVGHQWYWRYELRDFEGVEFDSYIVQSRDLIEGAFRLLEVDNRLVLPQNTETRAIIGSQDVLHSWRIPSLGIKIDATPGRLSQVVLRSSSIGKFYGQCSEICGANHRFMPIRLEIVSNFCFQGWVGSFYLVSLFKIEPWKG